MKVLDIVAIWGYRAWVPQGDAYNCIDRNMVADFPADLKQYSDNHQTILADGPNGLVFIYFGDFQAWFWHPMDIKGAYCEYSDRSFKSPLWVCPAGMPERIKPVLKKLDIPDKVERR